MDYTGVLDDGLTGTTHYSLLSEFTDHGKLEERRDTFQKIMHSQNRLYSVILYSIFYA